MQNPNQTNQTQKMRTVLDESQKNYLLEWLNDNKHYLTTTSERESHISKIPEDKPYIKAWIIENLIGDYSSEINTIISKIENADVSISDDDPKTIQKIKIKEALAGVEPNDLKMLFGKSTFDKNKALSNIMRSNTTVEFLRIKKSAESDVDKQDTKLSDLFYESLYELRPDLKQNSSGGSRRRKSKPRKSKRKKSKRRKSRRRS